MDNTDVPAEQDTRAMFMRVCPPMTLVLRYAADDIPGRYLPMLRGHIGGCPECRTRLAAIRNAVARLGDQASDSDGRDRPDEAETLTTPEAREIAASVFKWSEGAPGRANSRREWRSVISLTYAWIAPPGHGKDGRSRATFDSPDRPGYRPDRSLMTHDPAASIFDHLDLEDRIALFVPADSPLLQALFRAARHHMGRCTIFPVEVDAAWGKKFDLSKKGVFPSILVPRMESVRTSERVAASDGRYLMPSNAAVVAGMEFALTSDLIDPDPGTRFVVVLPDSNKPFDYLAYEDELIELGLGHLIQTP